MWIKFLSKKPKSTYPQVFHSYPQFFPQAYTQILKDLKKLT